MIQPICIPEKLTEIASERWRLFSESSTAAGEALPQDGDFAEMIRCVFALSEFISGSCTRHPAMAAELIRSGDLERTYPSNRYRDILTRALSGAEKSHAPDDPAQPLSLDDLVSRLQQTLRTVRRREMIRIAFRDLAGWADLEETMAELSAFADTCLALVLEPLYSWHCSHFGTPINTDGDPQRLVVIAMGKLGANELNFSSDIDLIFAYPETGHTTGETRKISNDEFFTRLTRQMIRVLGASTPDGIVFRVDTGLRPFGESGPMVMNFTAMERYYQRQGREWERYAWIKARPCAGDMASAERLLDSLKPFVYRRYLDYGVFESLREMKGKISREVKLKKMSGNIKLGPGGIREIEFFGQMFQLIRGGVVPQLQERRIQKVLTILSNEKIIGKNVRDELIAAYRFFRRVEHRLQAFADRQIHDLPAEPIQQSCLAASMGFPGWDSFFSQLTTYLEQTHGHFKTLLETDETSTQEETGDNGLAGIWQGESEIDTAVKLLVDMGYDRPEKVAVLLENLRNASPTRALSLEGRKRLDQLMPRVIKSTGTAERPVSALNRIIDLIKAIEQRTSYLSLLLENQAALDQLINFADVSPWIVSFMSKHPVLLDELLDSRSLFLPPAKEDLERDAKKKFSAIPRNDLESFIEELCVFKQTHTLRVAAADVTGILPLMKVSDHLSWIAETVLDRVMEYAWNQLVEKHGTPHGEEKNTGYKSGFAVVAYGKLGGLELGYDSDLDLVFLHTGGAGVTQGGVQPIDTGQFFARLGQRMIHILTAHTRAGRLYETDMRLRPSGSSGPLVSELESFGDYQVNDAWTWENQAMVRARAVCGDPRLVDRFNTIREKVLRCPRDEDTLRNKVSDMRNRIRREHGPADPDVFHLKQDPGGIVDIEFLAQHLVLLKSSEHHGLTRWSDNVRILESLMEAGIVDNDTSYRLKRAYLTYRAKAHRLSLQEKSPIVDKEVFKQLREDVIRTWKRWMVG